MNHFFVLKMIAETSVIFIQRVAKVAFAVGVLLRVSFDNLTICTAKEESWINLMFGVSVDSVALAYVINN